MKRFSSVDRMRRNCENTNDFDFLWSINTIVNKIDWIFDRVNQCSFVIENDQDKRSMRSENLYSYTDYFEIGKDKPILGKWLTNNIFCILK